MVYRVALRIERWYCPSIVKEEESQNQGKHWKLKTEWLIGLYFEAVETMGGDLQCKLNKFRQLTILKNKFIVQRQM